MWVKTCLRYDRTGCVDKDFLGLTLEMGGIGEDVLRLTLGMGILVKTCLC